MRVLRDRAQAEEVTQEAYLDMLAARRAASTRPRAARSGWLLTIVHRKAVDRVRSAEASGRRDAAYHRETSRSPTTRPPRPPTASLEAHPGPRGAGAPDHEQREAVELAFFGGYTHTEVATMLDLPVGTAKTRIRDGLIRLRDAMGVGR